MATLLARLNRLQPLLKEHTLSSDEKIDAIRQPVLRTELEQGDTLA